MSKTSNLNLYSSDNLDEKALHVVSVDAKLSLTSPNEFELSAPKFKLAGQTVSANDVADLGQHLADIVSQQASDHLSVSASVSTNLASISAVDVREVSNHSAQATLLGIESATRSSEDAVIVQSVTDEVSARIVAVAGVQTSLDAEIVDRASAVSAEASARTIADSQLQVQIDAINVIDAGQLASINQMLADYQAADNTISGLISALTARVVTLEAVVASLTA